MMTAVSYLSVFQGAKRSGNTLAVLPKRATQENRQIVTAQRVAAITEPEAVLASCLQPAWGCAHNTSRRNGLGRFADRQTRQGEPSEHRVTGVTMKPAQQPERRGHREMARQSERIKAAHGFPGHCFASATAYRNSLNAIKSALP